MALVAIGLWIQPGTLTSVMGPPLTLALLWLVFEVLYRLLKTDGIASSTSAGI